MILDQVLAIPRPTRRTLSGMDVAWLPLSTFGGVAVREYRVTCTVSSTRQTATIEVAATDEAMAREVAAEAVRLDLGVPAEDVTVANVVDVGPSTL